ncbi:hypothetical protein GYA93_17885 [Gordonia desulfuricans]|uniref:ParB N-terminal domain-containing protein n=1 Tax=Gordonia desulfuricans TaxID=89051 RepID=A0A7K3LT22_9ACTN|nr:DUF6551 family protein [Gordonia desulfuricans]NDK91434.1 hypothetical protein [Gordonia desulfuricans]
MSTPDTTKGTYVTALPVSQLFTDPAYQRELDTNRARFMSQTWDPRLVGVIDVADRGPDTHHLSPRYAVINGQHRWKAAVLRDPQMSLACNVHTGLTVEEEAKLFWDSDRRTKSLSTWDRWKARRQAGDQVVVEVERIAASLGLRVEQSAGDNHLQCCAALEFLYGRRIPETIHDTLELIDDVWPGQPQRYNAAVIKGIGLTLFDYADDLDTGRLADAMSDLTPRQLIARAHELKASYPTTGIPMLVTAAAVAAYNRAGRTKLAPPLNAA